MQSVIRNLKMEILCQNLFNSFVQTLKYIKFGKQNLFSSRFIQPITVGSKIIRALEIIRARKLIPKAVL